MQEQPRKETTLRLDEDVKSNPPRSNWHYSDDIRLFPYAIMLNRIGALDEQAIFRRHPSGGYTV